MRQAGDFLQGGASGAGSLLLNTKASQEAACSRASAAIVLGRAVTAQARAGLVISLMCGTGGRLSGHR